MKIARSKISSKTHALPRVQFEEQDLTSFGGLVIFQPLFQRLKLFERLRACCRHIGADGYYGCGRVMQLLIAQSGPFP